MLLESMCCRVEVSDLLGEPIVVTRALEFGSSFKGVIEVSILVAPAIALTWDRWSGTI